jgi:hypothetical protein
MVGVRFRVGASYFFILHSIQADFEAYPASNPMDTEGYFSGVKRPGREADHSFLSSAEVKNGGAIPPLADMSSWRGA